MPWWALYPVVLAISGPVALYAITRRKRRSDDADDRYQELAREHAAPLGQVTSGGPPAGPADQEATSGPVRRETFGG
ncbi:hypothetical protein [Streptomyces sp. AF1A]|uniref:hypothetical protein n=1 Tax=Streptomyces sp. AF1A TaxID=3394350 RepID=UPI0039BC8664